MSALQKHYAYFIRSDEMQANESVVPLLVEFPVPVELVPLLLLVGSSSSLSSSFDCGISGSAGAGVLSVSGSTRLRRARIRWCRAAASWPASLELAWGHISQMNCQCFQKQHLHDFPSPWWMNDQWKNYFIDCSAHTKQFLVDALS